MSLKLFTAGLSAAALVAPLPVGAQSSIGCRVSLLVPVHCQVCHSPLGAGDTGGTYSLGWLTEFCNVPAGYDLRVQYTPGALQGMLLMGRPQHHPRRIGPGDDQRIGPAAHSKVSACRDPLLGRVQHRPALIARSMTGTTRRFEIDRTAAT